MTFIYNRFLHLLRILALPMLVYGSVIGQVKIKETVTINPSKVNLESVSSAPTLTWVYHYTGCVDGATTTQAICELIGPCDSYHQIVYGNPVSTPQQEGIAEITVTAYDPGDYSFYVRQKPTRNANANCGNTFEEHLYHYNGATGIDVTDPGPIGINTPYPLNISNACSSEDLQPQILSESNFETYAEGSSFTWADANGTHTVSIGDGCSVNPSLQGYDLGKTFIPPRIPVASNSQPPYYVPGSDITLSVCLFTDGEGIQRWHYNISNLRIPIFESTCHDKILSGNFTDLGDGHDWTLLSQYITDCASWNGVLKTLKWWKKGPYHHPGETPPTNFVFTPGILKHEDKHVLQRKLLANDIFKNTAFPQIDSQTPNKKSDYPCAMNAIDANSSTITSAVAGYITDANNVEPQFDPITGTKTSELEADDYANDSYEQIKRTILFWARNQLWWVNNTCRTQ